MKKIRVIFLFYVLSIAIAFGLTFINDGVIEGAGMQERFLETIVASVPIFLALTVLYLVYLLIAMMVKAVKKKKPSGKEGSGS